VGSIIEVPEGYQLSLSGRIMGRGVFARPRRMLGVTGANKGPPWFVVSLFKNLRDLPIVPLRMSCSQ
jgi:hypothetical protein